MSWIVKVCKKCGRFNPQDTTRCVGCGGSDFEPVQLLPNWLVEFAKERTKQ